MFTFYGLHNYVVWENIELHWFYKAIADKCWPVLFLWIHNRIETRLHSATTEPWVYGYKMTAMTGYRLLSCMYSSFNWIVCQEYIYSASENIHHPLIETEEIMDLIMILFAIHTLRRLHQFINFASFLYDCHLTYISSLIEVVWSGRTL